MKNEEPACMESMRRCAEYGNCLELHPVEIREMLAYITALEARQKPLTWSEARGSTLSLDGLRNMAAEPIHTAILQPEHVTSLLSDVDARLRAALKRATLCSEDEEPALSESHQALADALLAELSALREATRLRTWPEDRPDWTRDTINPAGRCEACVLHVYSNGDVSMRWLHKDGTGRVPFKWLPLPQPPREVQP